MDQQQETFEFDQATLEVRTPYQTSMAELTSSRVRSSLSLGRRLQQPLIPKEKYLYM